jgi:hypothetical protein
MGFQSILSILILATFACTSKKSKDGARSDRVVEGPSPPPTVPQIPITGQPTGNTSSGSGTGGTTTEPQPDTGTGDPQPPVVEPDRAKLFTAALGKRSISMYKIDGTPLGLIDLTDLGTGFVTAMTWLDHNTMLAFFDTGSQTRKIIKISFVGDSPSQIFKDWHADPVNLNSSFITQLFSPGFAKSPLILIPKGTSTLEAITTDAGYTKASRVGTPYLTSSSNCPLSKVTYVTKNPLGDRLIVGSSSGTFLRLNVYGPDKACLSSYNYNTNFPALATPVSVIGLAATDTSIFVRFQHSQKPTIAKCDFDGTSISSCVPLIDDPGMLGVNSANKEMLFEPTLNNLIYANLDSQTIMQADAKTGYAYPLIRDEFSARVTTMSLRP